MTKSLEQKGFLFSPSAAAYVSHHSPSSPITPRHRHHSSTGNVFDFPSSSTAPPSTPPASNVDELQTQTFSKLKRAGIVPTVDKSIRLVSCAARKETNPALDSQLRDDLSQILLATCPGTTQQHETKTGAPDFSTRFLSLTLTSEEPISLLLETSHLSNPTLSLASTLLFSQSSSTTIQAGEADLGAGKDVLIPITLDLRDLPLEATGIVCGVAGRLAQGTSLQSPLHHAQEAQHDGEKDGSLSPRTRQNEAGPGPGAGSKAEAPDEAVEISFLSTARAGTVIVREKELDRAIRALDAGAEMV